MYIEIGDSIGRFLKAKKTSDVLKKQIESILLLSVISIQHGHHCVNTQSEECALSIYRNSENNQTKQIFCHIYQNYSTYLAGLKNQLQNYIRIENTTKDIERVKISDEKYVTIVSLDVANRLPFWESVCFLPENIRDYRFFLRIANYKKEPKYDKIKFSLRREQGQGSRAIDTYICRCSEKNFIFALLDNDISKPGEAIRPNSTAYKFLNSVYKDSPYGFFHILNVHELENLFSSKSFISKVDHHVASQIEESQKIDPNVTLYYDMKNGITYSLLMKNEYMKQFINRPISPCSSHIDGKKCPNGKCNRTFLNGLGGQYLERLFGDDPDFKESVTDIESKTKKEFSKQFKSAPNELAEPIKKEWSAIYTFFLTYFCSYSFMISGA